MAENPPKDSVEDEWVIRRQRKDAMREMDALRKSMPDVSSDEVAEWIREDREQGH